MADAENALGNGRLFVAISPPARQPVAAIGPHQGCPGTRRSSSAGNDTFVFSSALNNVDTISDFNANAIDKIALDNDIFTAFGATTGILNALNFSSSAGGNATDADDYILYDTVTGNLYYDADGNGAGAKILFGQLDQNGLSGSVGASDFFLI